MCCDFRNSCAEGIGGKETSASTAGSSKLFGGQDFFRKVVRTVCGKGGLSLHWDENARLFSRPLLAFLRRACVCLPAKYEGEGGRFARQGFAGGGGTAQAVASGGGDVPQKSAKALAAAVCLEGGRFAWQGLAGGGGIAHAGTSNGGDVPQKSAKALAAAVCLKLAFCPDT